jgi:hypothetical protein
MFNRELNVREVSTVVLDALYRFTRNLTIWLTKAQSIKESSDWLCYREN